MDANWEIENYIPSHPNWEQFAGLMDDKTVRDHFQKGQLLSQALNETPYDPFLWFERGNTLLLLGLPELAMGDLHKARLLCQEGMERRSNDHGLAGGDRGAVVNRMFAERVFGKDRQRHMREGTASIADQEMIITSASNELRDFHLVVLEVLIEALIHARCYADATKLADEAIELYPDYQAFSERRAACDRLMLVWQAENSQLSHQEAEVANRCGYIFRRHYPWMQEQHSIRTTELLGVIQSELDFAIGSRGVCSIRRADWEEGRRDADEISVFAERDVERGEILFVDRTLLAATSDEVAHLGLCDYCFRPRSASPCFADCCSTAYCSTSCRTRSMSTYHSKLCNTDFSFLQEKSPEISYSINPTTLLPRFVATYLNQPSSDHPLSHPLLSRWKSDIRIDPPRFPLSFDGHIRHPLGVLEALGVDIFADHRFDTWVLQNILNRIGSNTLTRHVRPVNFSPPLAIASSAAAVATATSAANLTRRTSAWPRSMSNSSGGRGPPSQSRGATYSTILNLGSLIPLFNHACRPNLEVDEGGRGFSLRAKRNIAEGEELCVSYVIEGMDDEARRKALGVWFNHCLCVDCNPHFMDWSGYIFST